MFSWHCLTPFGISLVFPTAIFIPWCLFDVPLSPKNK
jgi:hypothetical protein